MAQKESPGSAASGQPNPVNGGYKHQRVICFRIDDDLDRRILRALRGIASTRSAFIRNAIERALKQDAEERLRVAQSSIDWG